MPSDRDPSTPYVLEPVDPAELADPPGPPPAIDVVLGTNLAYEAVSHASAAVVQDAGSLIRQFSVVSTAALAVATEKLMEAAAKQDAAGVTNWTTTIGDLTKNLEAVGKVYSELGAYAAIVKGYFVPGASPPSPPSTSTGAPVSAARSRGRARVDEPEAP